MFVELLLVLLALLGYFYWRFQQKSQYWSRLGVKQSDSVPFPLGDNPAISKDILFNRVNQGDVVERQYNKFKGERFYGTYLLPSCHPTLMISDPEIIRDVMVKNFNHFVDRNLLINFFGVNSNLKTDMAWEKQMTNLKGEEWKDVRSMFSPIFTSGKLKTMVQFINGVSDLAEAEVAEAARTGKELEMKEIFGKFSMDTIASCAFGVEAGSFGAGGEKSASFVNNAKQIFTRTGTDGVRFLMANIPVVKDIVRLARIPVFKPKETEFFYEICAETLRHRIQTKTRRNDLIDLMVDAMKEDLSSDVDGNAHAGDQFEADSQLNHKARTHGHVDELTLVATAMIMLIAGYDTTAQTLSFVGYELARNKEVQRRLQEEIDEAFSEADDADNLDYNVVQGMPYLDMVIHEALRLHSPVGLLIRGCVKDYVVPGTNITIKAGGEIYIPVQGIHRDEKYYPDPLTFNPENFSKEAKAARDPYTFLAFGQGPRSCIGMRFALLEAKIGLIKVLRRHSLVPTANTPKTITRDPASILGNVLEPLLVKVVERT